MNPLNSGTSVVVISTATDPAADSAVAGGGSTIGWVFDTATNKIFATTKTGTKIYNESTGANAEN